MTTRRPVSEHTPPASRHRGRAAYTLVEVMVASVVVLLGIVTAITAIQRGFQSLDFARNLATASQLMQSEMEEIRLKNWSQLQTLQAAGDTTLQVDPAGAAGGRYTRTRSVRLLKEDMLEITLTTTWRGYDGRRQTARLITRYGKNGLNDYISTAH